MATALILGDYKVDRLAVPLARRGYTVAVWSAQEPPRACHELVQWHRRTTEITADTVTGIVRTVRPDLVLPNVYALTEEHALTVYAAAADDRWYAHPPAFAEACVDKAGLHGVCTRSGIRTPPGRVCHDDESLLDFSLHFAPLVIKLARSQARQGIWHCANTAAVERLLPVLGYPILAQKFLQGEELAVEVLSTSRGRTRFPVISSGDLDGSLDPQGRVRVAPRYLSPSLDAELTGIITELETRLHPNGIWQLDLAISDGHIHLLEVNGRLGGASDLGRAVTGVDPHQAFVAGALGEAVPHPRERRMAIAVPLVAGSRLERPRWWRDEFLVERYETEPEPIWRLTAATAGVADLRALIDRIEDRALVIDKSELVSRTQALCRDFRLSPAGEVYESWPA